MVERSQTVRAPIVQARRARNTSFNHSEALCESFKYVMSLSSVISVFVAMVVEQRHARLLVKRDYSFYWKFGRLHHFFQADIDCDINEIM